MASGFSPTPSTMQNMPASVQAVLQFDYPKDLVLSTYQQLFEGAASTQPGGENTAGATGAATLPPPPVTAALLMMAVDAVLGSKAVLDSDKARTSAGHRSELAGGSRRWNDDVERDGADECEVPSTSSSAAARYPQPLGSNPGPIQSTANSGHTSGTTEISTPTSDVSTSEVINPNTAVSATVVSGQRSVAFSEPLSEIAIPQQPQTPVTATSSPEDTLSSPSGAEGGQTRLAEDRARQRRQQLSRLRALRVENARLKARQLCRQCRLSPVDLTLLPCGHLVLCHTCGSAFDTCPACKRTVLADVRTFLS